MPLVVTNDEVTSGSRLSSFTGSILVYIEAFQVLSRTLLTTHQLAISLPICLSRFHVP